MDSPSDSIGHRGILTANEQERDLPDIQFDRYYNYEDLTRLLHAYQQEFPTLVQVDSLGHSYEGRDVWVVTVTNQETGPDREKPALWVDGNIHATELSPSTACLYLLHTLVQGYGQNADVTRALDTRTFYICPRVNPDGAEWALETPPRVIRSSTRPYPHDEEQFGGLVTEDIDGDGRILTMRVPDANGAWKQSETEPRLLVRRDPTETGGEYFRLLPEGRLEEWDGVNVRLQPRKQTLDINRNFPAAWRGGSEQPGAGPYPTSEPEVHNLVDFISRHANITGGISFHTFSGVLLRPYSDHPDEKFAAEDLWTYQKIGDRGTDMTGYPNLSVFHGFRYHPREVITGVFDDWLFDHLGVFGWTVEIWSPQREAGIENPHPIEWRREHPFEDDVKMLRWSDEELDGRGYVDWQPFQHPQLGQVDIGGWDMQFAFRNPPPKFLEREVARFSRWVIWHLLISPLLELYERVVEPLGDDMYRVRLAVQNTGWLPTYVTKKALEKKLRGVVAEITLPEGAELVAGHPRETLGQLEGRAYQPVNPPVFGTIDGSEDRLSVEWIVRAPHGGTAELTARHERAGTVRTEAHLTART